MGAETAIGWIREVVLDGPDPWVLARFWAGLLGGSPVEWYPGWVTLEPPPHGQRLSFQGTAAPLAQDTARVHFDILVEDLTAAHARVVSAGATPVGEHVSPRPGPDGEPLPWRVYRADTAGARRVDWLDAGHLPALERPADFLDLLREWTAE
jgi:pimeloyl-ACP methyl ester carboxylesterase